jgi:hypothetical protein
MPNSGAKMLMLFGKTVAICGEECTEHINVLCENTHFLFVTTGRKQ